MTPLWGDVTARARGLGTHLLSREQVESLARAPDIAALASALRQHRVLSTAVVEAPTPEEIELGVRRWAAGPLRIVGRWAGPRAVALPLVFDEEDRRSIRAIIRGAAQRAPAAGRLAGLIPTPALPERALEELARAPTIAAAGALLSAWKHPFAAVVAPLAAAAEPDLLALDVALARAAADRAGTAARRGHDRAVRAFVRDTIDLENGRAAVLLAGAHLEAGPAGVFLEGGARLTRTAFEQAVAAGTPVAAGTRIATALAGSPCAGAFANGAGDPAAMEDELLRCRLQALTRHVRQQPLDALSVIWFALRLRAQVIALQRIIWTVALGGPRQWLLDLLAANAA